MKSKIVFKFISIILIISMLIGDLINSRPAYAEEEMNDWARSSDSEIEFEGDRMYWIKTHNAAPNDNVIRYETMEYVVTKQKLDTNYDFNSGPNASVSPKVYIKQSTKVIGTDSNIKEREYSMNRNDFFANEFKLTDKELKEGVTLYLNPIFRTYQGNVTLKENIENVKAIVPGTQFTYTLQSTTPVKYKDIFNYTLPEDLRTLINIYTYTDSYYFTYTDIKGKSVTEGNFSGSSISYEMPNAKPGSIATFYMIYGPNGNPPEEEEPDLEIPEVIVPDSHIILI